MINHRVEIQKEEWVWFSLVLASTERWWSQSKPNTKSSNYLALYYYLYIPYDGDDDDDYYYY